MVPTSPFWEAWPRSSTGGVLWGRLGGGQAQAGLASQSCDSWAWRIPPPLPARLPHKAPIVQENHAIVSCSHSPHPRDSPLNPADSTPGLGLGSVRWEARLREAEGTLPAIHHNPDFGREAGNWEGVGGAIPAPSSPTTPPPQLFPPLQAAGLEREQRLEQGQEASSGAAGNAGSGGEGGEQGPGLLFHFFWKENWRKNRRWESPPPRPSGNPPQAGAGSGGSLDGQGPGIRLRWQL